MKNLFLSRVKSLVFLILMVSAACTSAPKNESPAEDAVALVERLGRYQDNPSMEIFGPSSFLGNQIYQGYEQSYSSLKNSDAEPAGESAVTSVNMQDPNLREQMQSDLEEVRQQVKENYQMLYEVARCDKKGFKVLILKDCPLPEEQKIAKAILDKWDRQTDSLKRVDGGQVWSNLNEYFYSDFYWIRENLLGLYKAK